MSISDYPVIGQVETAVGIFPLLDIPMMSDERWNQLARKDAERRAKQEELPKWKR